MRILSLVSVHLLFIAFFSLTHAISAPPLITHPLIIYSNQVHSDEEWKAAARASIFFWQEFADQTDSKNFTHNDSEFNVVLKFEKETAYLELTHMGSQNKFYHYSGEIHSSNLDQHHSFNIQELELDAFNFEKIKELTEIAGKEQEAIHNWEEGSLKVISEIEVLYLGLLQEWRRVQLEYPHLTSDQFYEEFINTKKINYKHSSLGSAELNSINKIPFIRVIHHGTELSFLITEEGSIDPNSSHFKQYVSRQHIAAGSSRTDGQYGRDVILIQVPSFKEDIQIDLLNHESYSQHDRHTKYSGAWWKDYWLSIKKWPTLSTASFGVFSGALQLFTVGITASVISGVSWSAGAMGFEYFDGLKFPYAIETAATSFIYGSLFGMIASMFKNWERLPAPAWRKTLKNMSNSLVFYYLLSFVISGGNVNEFAHQFNPFTHEGLIRNLMIITAAFLSNRSKPNWYNIADIREQTGISRGNFKLGPIKTQWSKPTMEYQIFYLPNFAFRLIERLATGGGSQLTPAGAAVMLFQIPFSSWVARWYANYIYKKTNHPKAKEIADKANKEFERKVRFFTDPRFAQKITKKFLKSFLATSKGWITGNKIQSTRQPRETFHFNSLTCKSIFTH